MYRRATAGATPTGRPPADIPAELLPHLALPDPGTLPEERVTGRACVWGGGSLTLAVAIDLGERVMEGGQHWFPQACGPCLADHACKALFAHVPACSLCTDTARFTECEIGRGLDRLQKRVRRMERVGDCG
ncbi:hypothetical protein E5083_12675 [Streptomyces bauhiniae]|uniref:Uncharacterized protein n=1 Tax=Streptomyces bauhiniae TaxID=2340725 RepID=A0A4Z1D847_9ACTN|nr:hypothetical protein [Streptomyces bauhiniae]TGN78045.1 hypothetical protein E5083_12675 [Streptomyces bauhiniae]